MARVAAVLLLALSLPYASRAGILFVSPDALSYSAGDTMTIDLQLATYSVEGPGEIEFTFAWGQLSGLSAAAATLLAPVQLGPNFSLVAGSDDCSSLVGQASGSCHVRAVTSVPVESFVARLLMRNDWIVPPGYELCVGAPTSDCVAANGLSSLDLPATKVFGESSSGFGALVGSAQNPLIRPIPEPDTAALLALGTAALARRRKR
jgi:hypothetical protein